MPNSDQPLTQNFERDIFSVSRLVRETRAVLESSFPLFWIEGEISNFSRPASGHMYFSLKDEAAQVRCAMFRGKNIHLRFKPENGMHVLIRARPTLYEARGDFQLLVEHLEEAGLGALQRAFEELKTRLGKEGLFDTQTKQTLPALPKQIGVITSPTGAAIRDILSVLKRRFPAIPVLIYPTAVQGENAATEIASTIKLADQRKECDVLILARGGGSLEDLWSFNEEVVARAIHACQTPLISAVGHEVDFTIADFVADQRAPTPSAAAELVTPDQYDLRQRLGKQFDRLNKQFSHRLQQSGQTLDWLLKRLQQQHPEQDLLAKAQRLNEIENRMQRQFKAQINLKNHQLAQLSNKLHIHAPTNLLNQMINKQQNLTQRLHYARERIIEQKRQRLAIFSRTLNNVSPLATLDRGYAIVQDKRSKKVYTDAGDLNPGDQVSTRLARGILTCTVDKVETESK